MCQDVGDISRAPIGQMLPLSFLEALQQFEGFARAGVGGERCYIPFARRSDIMDRNYTEGGP